MCVTKNSQTNCQCVSSEFIASKTQETHSRGNTAFKIVLYFMDWSNFFFIYFSNLDSVGECEVFSPEPVDHNANFTSMSEVKKQSNGDDLVSYISTLFTGFA